MDAALAGLRWVFIFGLMAVQFCFLCWFLWAAYDIRLYPVKDFGYIIHEFDPWFNYRAAEYLAENGLTKFFHWYDYESWYPLGRPIGTTIYPGMQITAVVIWETIKALPDFSYEVPGAVRSLAATFTKFIRAQGGSFIPPVPKAIFLNKWSMNDICVMMPAWFGSIASLFTGLLTYEVSRSMNAALCGVGIMAVIPAHLMRSVAGEFDNEAVAMAAIVSTSWLWVRAVRTPSSWLWGIPAGLSYIYMVAAWGGYIFVINMIGVHALLLVVLGRFNSGVYKAYTLFFILGTGGAMQIPVVGWTPLRSMEQIGPLGVFFGYQVLAFCDWNRRRYKMGTKEFIRFRIRMMCVLAGALLAVCVLLWPTGYFGPLSSRIRGLFVRHTKTGNPLVDSVAEHQPASPGIYSSYLNLPLDFASHAFILCCWNRNNGAYFVAVYAYIAIHFSSKMSRLVLICGPICTVGAAIWCGFCLDFLLQPFLLMLGKKPYKRPAGALAEESSKAESNDKENGSGKKRNEKEASSAKGKVAPKPPKKNGKKEEVELMEWDEDVRNGGMAEIKRHMKQQVLEAVSPEQVETYYKWRHDYDNDPWLVKVRCIVSAVLLFYVFTISGTLQMWGQFVRHADDVAKSMSNPQVVYKVQQRDGRPLIIDDYLRGYEWIDKNTAKDARVMAWWDYGYQITGIAKRTSIADGNTWNHEHIATLGKMLTSSQKKAHNAIRHLADYVLVWAGGGGDDLAKSPHLARIGNSVFPDHCGDDDPKCSKFGFYSDHSTPTPMMKKSLLYNLVSNGQHGAKVHPQLFQEVHTTKYGLMRVYKVMNISEESKEWVADPANRICDAPGSWYCIGQYPPALAKLIAQRRSFSQLEDFNKQGEKSAYTRMIEKESSGQGHSEM